MPERRCVDSACGTRIKELVNAELSRHCGTSEESEPEVFKCSTGRLNKIMQNVVRTLKRAIKKERQKTEEGKIDKEPVETAQSYHTGTPLKKENVKNSFFR